MVELSNMTLFELRAYRAWLERTRAEARAEFKAENIAIMDFDLSAKAKWFTNQLYYVNNWIDEDEARLVRIEMEAKAQEFLGVKPSTYEKPRRFKLGIK